MFFKKPGYEIAGTLIVKYIYLHTSSLSFGLWVKNDFYVAVFSFIKFSKGGWRSIKSNTMRNNNTRLGLPCYDQITQMTVVSQIMITPHFYGNIFFEQISPWYHNLTLSCKFVRGCRVIGNNTIHIKIP